MYLAANMIHQVQVLPDIQMDMSIVVNVNTISKLKKNIAFVVQLSIDEKENIQLTQIKKQIIKAV